MNIINKKIDLSNWINENTINSNNVVELGAGFFNRLSDVHTNVKTKIGIEIYKPYIDNAKYDDCIKIHGDALKYYELLKDYELDTVLIVDVLEHFNKKIGLELIDNLKRDFKLILIMIPEGEYKQNTDNTGFGGHEYQTHRSAWFASDFINLGFTEIIVDSEFHENYVTNVDGGCGVIFCIWKGSNDV